MSNGDNVEPIDLTASPGIGAVTSVAALLSLVATGPDAPPRPARAFEHPADAAAQVLQGTYWALKDLGVPGPLCYLVSTIAAGIVVIGGTLGYVLLWLLKHVASEFAIDTLELVDTARKEIDPTVAVMAVEVLNELLGTDFSIEHLASGEDVAAHIQRADEIGTMFHAQLMSEFKAEGDVTPAAGVDAAHRMTGFLVNFGVATAVIGLVGDIVSFGKFDQFRELGVEVARNLGLGRMHRQVMKPLINTLISVPYQWWLNQQFHPTQFREGDLVNPYTQTLMSQDYIFQAMDLLGYSHDKIEQLILLHSKRLGLAELELFNRYGILSTDSTVGMLKELGYAQDVALIALQAEDLKRADAAVRVIVDELEVRANNGEISLDEYTAMLDAMPLGPYEKKYRTQTVMIKVKAPHNHLTTAQAQKALEEGVWTLDELTNYFTARGYSADDSAVLQIETLLALAKLEDAAKVKAARAAAAAAKAAKKAGTTPPAAGG